MLTKRTNILFDQALWNRLTQLAKSTNTSVGKLVRDAVEEKYIQEDELAKRAQAVEAILKIRPKPFKGKIDYKALINYGRRF